MQQAAPTHSVCREVVHVLPYCGCCVPGMTHFEATIDRLHARNACLATHSNATLPDQATNRYSCHITQSRTQSAINNHNFNHNRRRHGSTFMAILVGVVARLNVATGICHIWCDACCTDLGLCGSRSCSCCCNCSWCSVHSVRHLGIRAWKSHTCPLSESDRLVDIIF